MPDQPKGAFKLLRPGRKRQSEQRIHRLANSIRVPWGVGAAALVLLGVLTAVLVGRSDTDRFDVPPVAREYQEALTREAAQSVRRGVNEGVDDISAVGLLSAAGRLEADTLRRAISDVGDLHGRYSSLYVIDTGGRVTVNIGAPLRATTVDTTEATAEAGMGDIRRGPEGAAVIPQWAPRTRGSASTGAVVGHYDPGFLRFALEGARPGAAWVVNREGRVVGSTESVEALSELPRAVLRDAARQAAAGRSGVRTTGGGIDSQEIIGFTPITGEGPAGRLGWGVVTTRSVASFALPETAARRHALLAGSILVVIALLIFGWLYIVVINPIVRLQREAERIAFGDLSRNVEVIRYDEIGIVARALERVRILLIRSKRR